jgi:hypothetical protein
MNFQAYCFKCGKTVTVLSILAADEFWSAIDENTDIEVVHTADDGDHRWKLNEHEKKNLRKTKTEGRGFC